MAKCKSCGREIGMFNSHGPGGTLCAKCNQERQQDGDYAEKKRADDKAIKAVILTTKTYPQDIRILERVGIVSAECAFGMNIFKDLFAGVRDIVGGRSEAGQKTMRDARRTALYELKKEAHEVGANAAVGVDLDYVELSAAGSMVMLVASGTAVKVEEA